MEDFLSRLDIEWMAVSAVRDLLKIASKGNHSKATYSNSFKLGGELYPELLGYEASILRRDDENEIVKEFRQRAELQSIANNKAVTALQLIQEEIETIEKLLVVAKLDPKDPKQSDQLKRKLKSLIKAEEELNPQSHSENQLIFRDAFVINRDLPQLDTKQGYRDLQLDDGKVLRIRVLHPEKAEHISGADVIYERHQLNQKGASIVAVQYKIWEDRRLLTTDPRMQSQIKKMHDFICTNNLCSSEENSSLFRFPNCAAFLRPTDKLQNVSQKRISTGEHLPICLLKDCELTGLRGSRYINYEGIKNHSVSGDIFENLFNSGKIGSRHLTYDELYRLYADYIGIKRKTDVIVHAQEFSAYQESVQLDAWDV